MAAHNNGGIVIAQVERIVAAGLDQAQGRQGAGHSRRLRRRRRSARDAPHELRRDVRPGRCPAKSACPSTAMPKMALDERKIIARRAAFELPPNGVINLGVGAPDGVAAVANEEKVTPYLTMTTEAGAIGGVLAGGSSFGSSANAALDHRPEPDVRLLPRRRPRPHLPRHGRMRRASATSTPASSAASSTAAAASSTSRRTRARSSSPARSPPAASKSRSRTASFRIVKEGRARKFVKQVEQITFSGKYAAQKSQPVIYVTERCVFQLTDRRA